MAGSATSNAATLTVTAAAPVSTITKQPVIISEAQILKATLP